MRTELDSLRAAGHTIRFELGSFRLDCDHTNSDLLAEAERVFGNLIIGISTGPVSTGDA